MYTETLSLFLSFFLSLCHSLFSSIPSNLLLGLIIDLAPPFPTLQSFLLDTLFCSSLFFSVFSLSRSVLLDSCFWMFEDEHLLEGGRCGSASHCETLSIAVASLSHQIILSQPPIAFTCSISLFAVFPLRTSPPGVFVLTFSKPIIFDISFQTTSGRSHQ